MIKQSKGKIFLSEERGKNETDALRSYSTFNFGNFSNEHKHAFGGLYVLNDYTLAGGSSAKMYVDKDCYIIFIPVTGAIQYRDPNGNNSFVSPGEIHVTQVSAGTVIGIHNPYESELVNYLHLRIAADSSPLKTEPFLFSFDIDGNKNRVIEIRHPENAIRKDKLPFRLSIAKLEGRREILYNINDKKNGIYSYVIEGAFEVQCRLLHPRDGLALWDIPQIEAEALSNDAILLVIEVQL